MPELPEVEVTRRGLEPTLLGAHLLQAQFSDKSLRWSAVPQFATEIRQQRVLSVDRRGKYLLIETAAGWIIVHLGMSGSLRFVADHEPRGSWDHFDLQFHSRAGALSRLRLSDPRRFGAVLWHPRSHGSILQHPLLAHLGPEPLTGAFSGEHLHAALRGKKAAIKPVLLAGQVVVGVGNIYASESLFRAGVRPQTAAQRLSLARCNKVVEAIQQVLTAAIEHGGSSLRDFFHTNGQSGHFQQQYFVYGRVGAACRVCGTTIRYLKQGQRSSFYCPNCQR
jgi:formamidopyrimidine-DNA glycosylase